MKRIFCLLLCLCLFCTLLCGCKKEVTPPDDTTEATVPTLATESPVAESETEPETEPTIPGIHYCGLTTMNVTAAQLAEAVGVAESDVISTTISSGEELLIVNDVLYKTILYRQLQCINYADKSVVTLTYILDDETLEGALQGIVNTLEDQFGTPSSSQSSSGYTTYIWRASAVNSNYICLYPLNDTELKLSFYLY